MVFIRTYSRFLATKVLEFKAGLYSSVSTVCTPSTEYSEYMPDTGAEHVHTVVSMYLHTFNKVNLPQACPRAMSSSLSHRPQVFDVPVVRVVPQGTGLRVASDRSIRVKNASDRTGCV